MHCTRKTLLWGLGSLLFLAGCGHQNTSLNDPSTASANVSGADFSGVWDWLYASVDEEANRRVEREEWHLRQRGDELSGYYVRTVTVVAEDDNVFRCNGRKRFDKKMRFSVEGRVSGGNMVLRETSVDVEPSPCDAFAHELQTYIGQRKGRSLALSWEAPPGVAETARRGHQLLFLRPGVAPIPRRTKTQLASAGTIDASAQRGALSGTWIWEAKSTNEEGDLQIEQEEWHIEQVGTRLRGYYDRLVTLISGDGTPYECNHRAQAATLTRYQVEGHLVGTQIIMKEVSFRAQPTPCDRPTNRSLNAYEGNVEGDEIRFVFEGATQVLKRNLDKAHAKLP